MDLPKEAVYRLWGLRFWIISNLWTLCPVCMCVIFGTVLGICRDSLQPADIMQPFRCVRDTNRWANDFPITGNARLRSRELPIKWGW